MVSSSSDTNSGDSDVFLSFRGDTRNNFISFIDEAFRRQKINFFIDYKLKKGEEIRPSLLKRIDAAKISVIVFSPDYAFSTFCLDETAKIIECLESKRQTLLPIFYNVDPSEIRKQNGTYGEALAIHESKLIEMKRAQRLTEMERVQRWKSALSKAANLLGWHIDDRSNQADVVEEIAAHISKLLKWKLNSSLKGQELMCKELVGITPNVNLVNVLDCLMSDEASRIGIYGMGGVGKTTMVARINNKLLSFTENQFQHIYWVTVSKETSIHKLQHDIAKLISIDLSGEEEPMKRASILWKTFLRMKKFLLILDDMWNSIDLEEVGIPISAYAGKLLLTTRNYGVCKEMKCEKICKIDPLSKQEAWVLFIRERGQIDDDPDLRKIAESVVGECVGLPLAIVTIAKSTMKFKEIYQWRNILRQLRRPTDEQTLDMEKKVFQILRVSYDRLQKDKYRQCLLYCALYPEDSVIIRKFLIRYWIGEGLIDELESSKEELDAGNSIIEELIDASLLERDGNFGVEAVKMHDVIRDMALTITRENFMVKAGLQLKDFPNLAKWSIDLERISIMNNPGLKRCPFNLAPNCPKLRTLLVQENKNLMELPNIFFDKMQNLLVLDMGSLESLRLLPESISKLKSLRVLMLRRCFFLEYIPSLAALEDLRHLDISDTYIKVLPEGMEKLVNLRMLFIIQAKKLKGLFPSAVLEKLSYLRAFCLEGTNVAVEPNALMSLEELETMSVQFENLGALNSYLKSRHWKRLDSYVVFTKPRFGFIAFSDLNDVPYEKTMYLCKDGETDIVFPDNVSNLDLWDWDVPLDVSFTNGNFANLWKLLLHNCKSIYLISTIFAQNLLRNIVHLSVVNSELMEEIIATEVFNEGDDGNYPDIVLPNLRILYLSALPVLKSIYRGMIVCPSLESIDIHKCEKLDRLPFCVLKEDDEGLTMRFPRLKYISGSTTWWDSLQWDHTHAKDALLPLRSNFYNPD